MRLLCSALPLAVCAAYGCAPGRAAFAEWYDQYSRRVRSLMRGTCSEYYLKCVLDILTLSGHVPDHHLSRWPCECPAYTPALTELFGKSPPNAYNALCYICYEFAEQHGGKLRFAEVLMHLCWNKRRASGMLQDRQSLAT